MITQWNIFLDEPSFFLGLIEFQDNITRAQPGFEPGASRTWMFVLIWMTKHMNLTESQIAILCTQYNTKTRRAIIANSMYQDVYLIAHNIYNIFEW